MENASIWSNEEGFKGITVTEGSEVKKKQQKMKEYETRRLKIKTKPKEEKKEEKENWRYKK